MIAATRKEKVSDRFAVAENAGLKPLVMDVESFAQMAALQLVVKQLPGGGNDGKAFQHFPDAATMANRVKYAQPSAIALVGFDEV